MLLNDNIVQNFWFAILVLIACLAASGQVADAAEADAAPGAKVQAVARTQAKGKVAIRRRAVVHGERIRLEHIADFRGFVPAERRRLERIDLGKSPRPGDVRMLSRRYLKKLLSAYAGKTAVSIPGRVEVRRSARRIGRMEIEELFLKAVCEAAGAPPERVTLKRLKLKDDLVVPSGETEIRVSFPPRQSFRGLATAKFDVRADKRHYRHYFVTGEVNILKEVVVVTRAVERGERLAAEDLRLQDLPLAETPQNAITDLSRALGMETKVGLNPGEALAVNKLDAPLLIQRGDLVALVVETAKMRVETKGIARQRGKLNQVIRVENISSKKVVYGKVVSSNEVRVQF